MTRGMLLLLAGTAAILLWASQNEMRMAGKAISTDQPIADTNDAAQPLATGDLNNQSGTYSTGVNPGA